jgi:hypothetical protein
MQERNENAKMDIDNLLQRNLLGGQEYEPLFPSLIITITS